MKVIIPFKCNFGYKGKLTNGASVVAVLARTEMSE